ncbi:aldo/keto reductase [Pyrofollis japonicus]|uniref:aldo/keto reductase n=1 Tax=Pyrofollis japonicus TaxID=3060460 RepID=UPI00295BCCBF|nr:aldo/keto reductase [Pyrofollis japonicus]BEP17832.1 aldo/keto reductase [Pyrofollis japonicus]
MKYNVLGRTGLKVSAIAYAVYGVHGPYEGLSRRDLAELVKEAWSLGINFYITAPVYGMEALEALRRGLGEDIEEAVVGVLVGYKRGGGQSFEPEFLTSSLEEACEALGKCPVDLAIIHDPGLEVLRNRALYEAMRGLVEDELASHLAVSISQDPDALLAAREALRHDEVEALRFVYNVLEQEPGATIAREAREKGRGIIVAMPHAGGLMLGETPSSWENMEPYYAGGKRMRGWYRSALVLYKFMEKTLREELATLLEANTPAQLALRFIYSSIPVDTIEVAARTKEKLRELVEASEAPLLSKEEVEKLRQIYEKGRSPGASMS